ncbi:MAG: hypothetical protein QM763_07745 [Agriterribacter sp.]
MGKLNKGQVIFDRRHAANVQIAGIKPPADNAPDHHPALPALNI